jgi:hypothetical protein
MSGVDRRLLQRQRRSRPLALMRRQSILDRCTNTCATVEGVSAMSRSSAKDWFRTMARAALEAQTPLVFSLFSASPVTWCAANSYLRCIGFRHQNLAIKMLDPFMASHLRPRRPRRLGWSHSVEAIPMHRSDGRRCSGYRI